MATLATKKKEYQYNVYSVTNYATADAKFIKDNKVKFNSLSGLIYELKNNDKSYHFRIHNDKKYIFFGDLDGYKKDINEFVILLKDFLLNQYNIKFDSGDFKYTQNNKNLNSYHYSIPKLNATTEKLKEIHTNFYKVNKEEFTINTKPIKKIIDTTIYSEHWFRCPNQSKGNINNQHIIINGKMKNFIIDFIPKNSINIDGYEFINKFQKQIIKPEINDNTQITVLKNECILSTTMGQTELYKKMFDECYKQERFEVYDYWLSIGMALKNTFLNEIDAINLFDYFSSKGSNYEGFQKTKQKFMTFIKKKENNGFTIATIYYYAIEDNKPKFIEIMNKNLFELGQTDICKYLKIIAGYKFIYKKSGNDYKLYCYNGKYWQNDSIIMKQCISNELYNFLKNILIEVYWNNKEFNSLKSKIEKLKTASYKKEIVETYKEFGINDKIEFDDKWWLFGFNNLVYDMQIEKFREYQYDDYILTTTGYDWRDPTNEEINTMNQLIESIMPIKEERESFLQILCTAIDGKCIEKFIIFNGCGGNGKGFINDLLLLAIGNYGMIGNNGILFESSKTGSNPEKANLHKKRYVVFREPPEKNKFENSIIKELTGGGEFSARGHHENETIKKLNLTMVVECNKRPLFKEEPTDAEIRRIIDIYFRSTFISNEEDVDKKKYFYLANPQYKTMEFKHKHKFALLQILFDEHKKFKKNNFILKMAKSIEDRTRSYLELSCDIVQWFKDNYKETNDKNDILKVKEIYECFSSSEYFYNLTKFDKQKYKQSFFMDYVQTNIFFRKYYVERFYNSRNLIKGWIKIDCDD